MKRPSRYWVGTNHDFLKKKAIGISLIPPIDNDDYLLENNNSARLDIPAYLLPNLLKYSASTSGAQSSFRLKGQKTKLKNAWSL